MGCLNYKLKKIKYDKIINKLIKNINFNQNNKYIKYYNIINPIHE